MKHRNLPHIDIPGRYQFITFRTRDSVDGYLLQLLSRSGNSARKWFAIDAYLDQSSNGNYLHGDALISMHAAMHRMDGELYDLVAFCIMPNHVHLLVRPLIDLSEMMKKLKGRTARLINQIMEKKGSFWANAYFDRLIRDERHFRLVYRYIKENPLALKEGCEAFDRFYGVYG